MKNLKLLIAFLAGVAITLLFTNVLHSFQAPHLTLNFGDSIAGTLGVIALILVGAYLSRKFAAGSGDTSAKFFDFLKRIKTSRTDCWLGGVCGGLGRITPIPSWVWRLSFAVAILYYGAGLLAYIALWIFIPEAGASEETAPNTSASSHDFLGFLHNVKRSTTDCWLGGVCGGLAEHSPVPAWVWRLVFAALFFCFGSGLLIYVLLWIFLPPGETKNQPAA